MSKIRLKGYSEEVHRKLLKELVSLNGRIGFRGYTKNDIVERSNGVLTYSPTNIVNNKIVNYKNDTYISQEKYIESPEIMVKNNDILFVKTGSTLGKSALVRNLTEPATINPQLIVIRTIHVDSDYLAVYLLTDSIQKQVFQVKIGGAVPTLTETEIGKFVVKLPPLREQSAIGSLFRTLDDLLASYKDNLANYQSLKATMLSKMFPKAGQTVPEIRLDGFDDEWEVLQLSDICQKVTEKNKNNNFNETFTNSAEFGIINQRDFFEKDISNVKSLNTYYVVRNNDFVYNPRISNFAPVGPVKRNKLGRTGVMSPLYFVFRIINSNIDLNFLETFFNTNIWHKFMKLNGDSGARADRFAIKDSIFLTMPISFPSLSEQKAIGTYFSNLDNLITSHQEKISQLETLKKKLLQDMFI
ncbi:restriction endonuclease subunit S [Streptococcus xiaochunlingii]|uniref:restriction endonuclease subunit S n=1 Tax=Streptococcus xiaochunlingii TaxID=2589788 RepID=UPI002556F436|nr:restriction endonuclease subunit S [Streptococcus xiaochunlingii]MDK8386968.1 restriction endonuclease subunit S [Streptococcus xiaochunlingii]MDK8777393.1 restriction endonuclease subunit S [Streptococcus xiaochunlingii]